MPTRYERGRTAEQYVKSLLKKQGAGLIVRSSRSLGPFDLIVFFPDKREIHLYQVKTSKRGVNLETVKAQYQGLEEYKGDWRVKTGFFVRSKKGWTHT